MLATAAIPAVSASEDNLAAVDVSALTGNASAALAQEPISVPADAQVSFSSIEVTAVAPVAAPTERRTPVAKIGRASCRERVCGEVVEGRETTRRVIAV